MLPLNGSMNLIDLLTGQANLLPQLQTTAMSAQPADPGASRVAEIEQLLAQPVTPQLMPVPDEVGRGKSILAALADAAAAYGRGLNPGVPMPGAVDMLRQRRQQREQATAYNTAESGRAAEATKRQALGMERDRLMREGDQAARTKEIQAERDIRAKEREQDFAAREEADRREMDFRERMATQEAERAKELAILRGQMDMQLAKVQAGMKSTEDRVAERQMAGEQRDALRQAKSAVIAVKGNVAQELQSKSPDQIRDEFLDAVDVLDLQGEYRTQALQFFQDKVEPMLRQVEQKAEEQRATQAQRTAESSARNDRLRTALRAGPDRSIVGYKPSTR